MTGQPWEQTPLARAAQQAAALCADGAGDDLVVLQAGCPEIPGEQDDDDVRAVAAIDVLRYLVDDYVNEDEEI